VVSNFIHKGARGHAGQYNGIVINLLISRLKILEIFDFKVKSDHSGLTFNAYSR